MFKKTPLYFLLALVLFVSGCATVPTKEALNTYNINGTNYVSLSALCREKQISWDYDILTKTISLERGRHKINLRVGDSLALVDNKVEYLHHPVDIYQGTVVVPAGFKEKVTDVLFRSLPAAEKIPLAASSIRKIVIDPGHGGHDPGAIGRTGLREKDVNLDMAKRLAKLLRNDGFEVIMTRSSDVFVPLPRRAAIANNAKADLFISIHANANRVRRLYGFEVYYISPWANDERRAIASARGSSLDFDGSCFYHASLDLKATLWDMIHTYNRGESAHLASNICRLIGSNPGTRVNGVKGANFAVLKGTQMPSILIEAGYLSNRDEERRLRNGYYRQQIVEAIEQGVKNYARSNICLGR